MTLCVCDGPAHLYTPSWCGEGREPGTRKPINKKMAAARLRLEAAKLEAELDVESEAE